MIRRMLFLIVTSIAVCSASLPHLNLFNPYDILLIPYEYGRWAQLNVATENVVKAHGFRDENDELCSDIHKGNILQLWQKEQNGLAALNTLDSAFTQQFLEDDTGSHGHFIPCADLDLHTLLFSLRYYICPTITIGAYIPFIDMRLKNVRWLERNDHSSFDDFLETDIISTIEQEDGINLGSWRRRGVGDLAILGTGFIDFPQAKIALRNVRLGLRGGLTFPTGKKADVDKLIAFPFGEDAGLGVLGAATIELWFSPHVRGGIDAEFLHLFGSQRCRRIQTDPAQTDLLFLTKISTFKEPGFMQHYTLYLKAGHFWRGLSGQIAYQFIKQGEARLFLCSDLFDPLVANNAENVQEWTTHHLFFSLNYDFYRECAISPSLMVFYKQALNGKRSIVADTVGAQISIKF